MKGMNETLIMNVSDDQHTETLKSIFSDSCLKNGVPDYNKDSVINNGINLFELDSSGDVLPLSSYSTIAEYVIAHRGDTVQNDNTTDATKEQLYNRLVGYAKSGNMKMYRQTRQLYASCSL